MSIKKTYKHGGLLAFSGVGRNGAPVDIVISKGSLKLYIDNAYKNTIVNFDDLPIFLDSYIFEKISFDPDSIIALSNIGEIRYSPDAHTLEVKVSNDVTIQLGQELVTRVKNDEDSTITNGTVVYISGASGANPLCKRASADDPSIAYRSFAVATEDLIKNELGFVTTDGLVNGINTDGIPEGSIIYLGLNGTFTATKPTAPTPIVPVGMCLRESATVGVIGVRIRPTPNLTTLSDVFPLASMTNRVVPMWSVTNSRFEFVEVPVEPTGTNCKVTPEGGVAIRMINGTGAPSVKGSVVSVSTTSDNQFVLQSNELDSIGVVYESDIANEQYCWIVVSGLADVLLEDSTSSTRGHLAIGSPVDGRFASISFPSSNPVVAEHFKEIGHVLESKTSGTNVLVRCVLHFN